MAQADVPDVPEMTGAPAPLLQVRGLTAEFTSRGQQVPAVNGIDFEVWAGESVGFVGESGSGKSVTARCVMRLEPEGSSISVGGSVRFDGRELLTLSEPAMRDVRGKRIAMVFQDPMTSLNPVLTVGAQVDDMLRRHTSLSRAAARRRTVELLDLVGIHEPGRRADDYPHQFSGGMRQRVLIAIAVSCEPDLLIADEPTTALDVTVQAQILRLLVRLREELGMALMLITHDFGVIAGMVDRVYVMYHGDIVESGPVQDILTSPRDAYTRSLIDAVPRLTATGRGR
jgi:ABC-type dipeptide/oligopeptide/nickel transport system ATPase component